MVSKVSYLYPLKKTGKFTSELKLSVSTIPDNISNLSSLLFNGGINKQE